MRANASFEEVALEPLPVSVDGVRVDPIPTSTELALPDVLRFIRQLADVPALAPWTHTDPRPMPSSRKSSTTFVRMIEIDAAQLGSFSDWWTGRARSGRLRATRALVLEAPRGTPSEGWRVRGALRRTPVELSLWPHIDGWTKLTLEPQRRVRVLWGYFRAGHRALDALTDRLVHEL